MIYRYNYGGHSQDLVTFPGRAPFDSTGKECPNCVQQSFRLNHKPRSWAKITSLSDQTMFFKFSAVLLWLSAAVGRLLLKHEQTIEY